MPASPPDEDPPPVIDKEVTLPASGDEVVTAEPGIEHDDQGEDAP